MAALLIVSVIVVTCVALMCEIAAACTKGPKLGWHLAFVVLILLDVHLVTVLVAELGRLFGSLTFS